MFSNFNVYLVIDASLTFENYTTGFAMKKVLMDFTNGLLL